jgi:glycerophosphoryl diester phosphodiesterase
MRAKFYRILIIAAFVLTIVCVQCEKKAEINLQRMEYNNPDLVVDLGVGLWAWPLPMDYDSDGDYDLLVACTDKPYEGTWYFENRDGDVAMPVFEAGVRIGPAHRDFMPSYVDDEVLFLSRNKKIVDVSTGESAEIYPVEKIHNPDGRTRANQWRYCDYDANGALDLIVGVGDWTEYGWDDAFNEKGEWTRGPLHGFVYLLKNNGTTETPDYAEPELLQAGDRPIDVYGMPTPNLADFDNDGDLDFLCGEFLDKFTYFENIGTRSEPEFDEGEYLWYNGEPITMDLEMIVPIALDWDRDGDVDLVVGQEDGRVALLEHTGQVIDGLPQFELPRFFKQHAKNVKFGALVTPYSFDWDDDGDEDLICGNTAGYIGFVENLDGGNPPQWAEPKYLNADGEVIHVQAGYNGSIQGPCEAKWGYTTLSVDDWDMDGLPDVMVNSIWGKVIWYKNVGTRSNPKLTKAQPVQVAWESAPPKPTWFWWNPKNNELATQWRTTPNVFDWDKDGLNDLLMLDHEGYFAFFQRVRQNGQLVTLPGERIFYNDSGELLQLRAKKAGGSGRRKICIVDWDMDGRLDLLLNSKNVEFWRNIRNDGEKVYFKNLGDVDGRQLAGHSTSPTVVDWDGDGVKDLLVGAEDGYFYFMQNKIKKETELNTRQATGSIIGSRDGFPLKRPNNGNVYVVAHRGVHDGIPENTLAAYQKAIDLGADFVEIDVRTTKDGRLVSVHNSTIDAYVDGITGPVRDFTLAELKALDIGSRIGPEWREERIPTVEEILDLCHRKIGIYVDLKNADVAQMVELIREHGMQKEAIWYTNVQKLQELQRLCPECVVMPDPHTPEKLTDILDILDPFVIASDVSQLSKKYIDTAHSRGTIVIMDDREDNVQEWRKILDCGTDGIQTDRPAELIKFIKANNY